MQRPAKVTRVSQATREKIIKAASRAFALSGYEGASIRTIVAEADVNQAAINYHFGSKEGLYRAVLETALRALMSEDTPQKPEKLSREAQLRQFVRRQLRPMTAREELSDYVRIFGWETLKPTAVFRKFMAREAAPFLRRRDRACPPLPTEPRDTRAGGRRRVVAVRTMQHFRAQRGAAGRPAAAPQDGPTLRERTCRDNNRLGRNRS